jgi:aryl-alcohol dehydrogenase-like predicted oxidoreductase
MAAEKKATLSQLVLRWTMEQPGITIALVGARDVAQAMENAKAMEVHLSSEEIAFINEELKQLTLVRK